MMLFQCTKSGITKKTLIVTNLQKYMNTSNLLGERVQLARVALGR